MPDSFEFFRLFIHPGQLQLQRNADYEPSESEDSGDELEFNSDASVSEDSEVEDEVLGKAGLVEGDAKIKEFLIYLTLELHCWCNVVNIVNN